MEYNASLDALLFPETTPPLFDASRNYTRDMIAAETARLAYFKFEKNAQSRSTIESALAIVGFDHVEYFSGNVYGGQALAALQNSGADGLLAFRGTRPNDIRDITIDLDIPRTEWPEGGTVHGGFALSFEELWQDIREWYGRTGERHTVIAGHSLGAGLATLCATRLASRTLITIGSSRVGDPAFASLFGDVEVHRFVGCCDVVTTLPPELSGFAHVGQCRYIDRSGVELDDPSPEMITDDRERARLDYLLRYLRIGNAPTRDLADHAPINYVSAIFGEREEEQP